MGIGNLTELTEADTTGVTALLIGFCQEVGIGAVLTTEVIGWAQGAVRATVLAAQIMHLAQRQARPPKHIDSGLVTSRDESMRAPSEEELRAMQSQISDSNYRLFADASGCTRSTAIDSSAKPTCTRCSTSSTWPIPRTRSTWARS